MRIDGIHITNFLSFDDFFWSHINPHVNVIIGPNGAGKTSLLHALRAVRDCLNYEGTATSQVWTTATHRGSGNQNIAIAVDVEFTGKWEQHLLCSFFAAALCDERTIQQYIQSQQAGNNLDLQALAAYAKQGAVPSRLEALSWFYSGRLVVIFDGLRWQMWYESRPGATDSFHLSIEDSRGISVFYGKQETAWQGSSIFPLWFDSPASTAENPGEGATIELAARASRKAALVSFLTKSPTADDSKATANIFPPLEVLPELVSSMYGIQVQVQWPQYTSLATHHILEEASGVIFDTNRMYSARWLFGLILQHSWVFTDNLRSLPRHDFTQRDLIMQDIDLSSGEYLALFLFRLKNGVTDDQSDRYTNIQKLFQALSGRSVNVGLNPSVESNSARLNRGERALQQSPGLELRISTQTEWASTPLESSGAGVVEVLLLSAIIEGSAHRVVLLDEPASNLHPLVQTSLLKEIQQRKDNQFLITTHSPALISPEALIQVSRLHIVMGHTVRSALDLSHIDTEQVEKIRKELRRSTDLRALLFSKAVILTEGETELGALPVWLEQTGFSLAQHDIAIYSVDGDTKFPLPVLFLQQFAVPWVLICDGKVISDSTSPRILKYLRSAGVPDLPNTQGLDFVQQCEALARVGIFTVAKNPDDEFEAIPVIHDHVEEAGREVGSSKARRGRYIAEHYPCPDEVIDLLNRLRAYFAL